MPSGYGQQTALWVPRIQALGHEVLISAFAGLGGAVLDYNGVKVLPAGQDAYGSDVITAHAVRNHADVVITLLDVWALQAENVKTTPIACWIPIDTDPLGDGDRNFLDVTRALPIAMSQFGRQMLADAGYRTLYVPHGIDTSVFTPRADRDELRERIGVAGKFVIGMNAANKDAIRKGFYVQFQAFADFHRTHPDSVLMVHASVTSPGALDLTRLAEACEIPADAIKFSDQYKMLMGLFPPSDIAAWLNVCDVLTNTSMSEGFGLTPLEALACGVPAIVTRASAMTELALGPEWLVNGDKFWNPTHSARWRSPYIGEITSRYAEAYEKLSHDDYRRDIRKLARERALQYDISHVTELWQDALAEISAWLMERTT